jgi:hypothetical protein
VLVDRIERLERPDMPKAEIRHIEPRRVWSSEAGDGVIPASGEEALAAGAEADLRAVAPTGHSFGRRGR